MKSNKIMTVTFNTQEVGIEEQMVRNNICPSLTNKKKNKKLKLDVVKYIQRPKPNCITKIIVLCLRNIETAKGDRKFSSTRDRFSMWSIIL